MDIVRARIDSPMAVSAIADAIVSKVYTVSRNLGTLEVSGLVASDVVMKHHVYCLTPRVRSIRRREMLQLSIRNDFGQWVLIYLDESTETERTLAPPSFFVDEQFLCPSCKGRLCTATF